MELLRLLAAERIVLFGWSLGAGVSLAAAARVQVAAVIAETPYRLPATPARNVLRLRGLPYRATLLPALALISLFQGRSLSTAKFDRAGHAVAATCPVLVLHGDLDEVCPLADGQSIAQSAPHGQTAIIRGGSHNALWSDPSLREQCTRAVQQFLEEAVAPTPTPS